MKPTVLGALIALAAAPALAGASPYTPNATPQAPPDMYYVCKATSRDSTTRYVSNVGLVPKPADRDAVWAIEAAWTDWLTTNVGKNKTMNAGCSPGPEPAVRKYRDDEINGKHYPKVEQVDWTYGGTS